MRSLKTDKITTMKIRLSDKLDAIRGSILGAPEEGISLEPNATFNDVFTVYEQEVNNDVRFP